MIVLHEVPERQHGDGFRGLIVAVGRAELKDWWQMVRSDTHKYKNIFATIRE